MHRTSMGPHWEFPVISGELDAGQGRGVVIQGIEMLGGETPGFGQRKRNEAGPAFIFDRIHDVLQLFSVGEPRPVLPVKEPRPESFTAASLAAGGTFPAGQ